MTPAMTNKVRRKPSVFGELGSKLLSSSSSSSSITSEAITTLFDPSIDWYESRRFHTRQMMKINEHDGELKVDLAATRSESKVDDKWNPPVTWQSRSSVVLRGLDNRL
ncbi:hypothetical protein ACFE04_024942 [Oxalis oulophora]